jgi:hypothetical protein
MLMRSQRTDVTFIPEDSGAKRSQKELTRLLCCSPAREFGGCAEAQSIEQRDIWEIARPMPHSCVPGNNDAICIADLGSGQL